MTSPKFIGTSKRRNLNLPRLMLSAAVALVCGIASAQTGDGASAPVAQMHCDKPIAKVMVGKLVDDNYLGRLTTTMLAG